MAAYRFERQATPGGAIVVGVKPSRGDDGGGHPFIPRVTEESN